MQRTAAFQRGYDAYLGSWKDKTNPYPPGSSEELEWWDGFNTAQADYAI